MPDAATWYFCRACSYRSLFVAAESEPVECPAGHDHGRDKAIMTRQDVAWSKLPAVEWKTGKEGA